MLAAFRRLSKSTVGSIVLVLFVLAILASFALADISNVGSGTLGFGGGSSLAQVGNQQVTDRDMSRAMERRLTEVRQQNPEADYGTIANDFDAILASLIDQAGLQAFADKYGFVLSKRLIDAEIAAVPGTRGLGGKFSEEGYRLFLAQQQMSDKELRWLISSGMLQRMLLTPVASNARVPVGMATPYASMLLEARQGEVANVPVSVFRAGLKPTDADLQRFYAANRARYTVPEQRVLRFARIGPDQVAGVTAADHEIAAYYNANQATYGAKDTRTLSQAVVPDQATAGAIAARAKAGGTLAAAAAPAGANAAIATLTGQSRQAYASVVGDKVAAAVFAAPSGAVVGPVQSDFGWVVVKVDSIRREGGKPLAAARAEIAAKLTADKRKNALTDLVARVEDAIAGGSNFTEAAAMAKLQVTETPLIAATGTSREDPSFRLPAELAPALRSGFELSEGDEPVVEALADGESYVLVAPSRIVPAAPAPLAGIRARVAEDWVNKQASDRAQAVANAIAAKAKLGVPLARAVAEAGAALPPVRPIAARRLDMSAMGANVPASIRMLFSLGAGKSRVVADPEQRGFSIVKVNRIVPGNALNRPALIGRVQNEFQDAVADEYARQFIAAIHQAVGLRRNEKAIAATKARISGG